LDHEIGNDEMMSGEWVIFTIFGLPVTSLTFKLSNLRLALRRPGGLYSHSARFNGSFENFEFE
jgi:hypothetical protein